MAARVELQGGVSYMGSPAHGYSAPTAFGELILDSHRIGSSNFTWSPDFTAGWIDGRNIPRYNAERYTTRDVVWLMGGGVRFHYGPVNSWYQRLFLSLQPALHTGRTQSLSSVYEFITTIGYQGDHWSLSLRHISNGSIREPNRGETMVLAGVRF